MPVQTVTVALQARILITSGSHTNVSADCYRSSTNTYTDTIGQPYECQCGNHRAAIRMSVQTVTVVLQARILIASGSHTDVGAHCYSNSTSTYTDPISRAAMRMSEQTVTVALHARILMPSGSHTNASADCYSGSTSTDTDHIGQLYECQCRLLQYLYKHG